MQIGPSREQSLIYPSGVPINPTTKPDKSNKGIPASSSTNSTASPISDKIALRKSSRVRRDRTSKERWIKKRRHKMLKRLRIDRKRARKKEQKDQEKQIKAYIKKSTKETGGLKNGIAERISHSVSPSKFFSPGLAEKTSLQKILEERCKAEDSSVYDILKSIKEEPLVDLFAFI